MLKIKDPKLVYRFQLTSTCVYGTILYTVSKDVNRIHWRIQMNARPKSEDPVELISDRLGWVCLDGYRWINGRSGPKGQPNGFLFPRGPKGRLGPVSDEAYLEFAALDGSPESVLEFAGRHGRLGTGWEHFHSDETPMQWGESWSTWALSIQLFKDAFSIWDCIAAQDERQLHRVIASNPNQEVYRFRAQEKIERHGVTLVDAALAILVEKINAKIGAGRKMKGVPFGCFIPGCQAGEANQRKVVFPGSLSYTLKWSANRGRAKVKPQIVPANLQTAIWFQFSQLVTGEREVRPCQVCGKLMDITDTARKGSKRMHERCSLAKRMQRYRAKLKNGE